MKIQIVYANADGVHCQAHEVRPGSTAAAVIACSGILDTFPQIDLQSNNLGVYGRLIRPDHIIKPGERIEIYEPAQGDAKQARRRRAQRSGKV